MLKEGEGREWRGPLDVLVARRCWFRDRGRRVRMVRWDISNMEAGEGDTAGLDTAPSRTMQFCVGG
jgi:hypothetical protein